MRRLFSQPLRVILKSSSKLCNKPLHAFDQDKDAWFVWTGIEWKARGKANPPSIGHAHFTGTGTRTIRDSGTRAISELFSRSFGASS